MIKWFKVITSLYKKHSKLTKISVFLLVFLFTFILRAHNYEKTPGIGHLEEQMFGWAGQFLIEEGSPVAWSSLEYPEKAEVYRGIISYNGGQPIVSVRLFKPWLEQPPLFSLMSGGAAHLMGANRHMVLPNAYIRIPSVLIATLVSFLVFGLAWMVSGYWIGLLAMWLYGTIPIFVFGSRLSVPENFISLLFITLVILIIKYQETLKWRYLIWFPVLAGLAGLSKPTGYFIIFLAAFFVFKNRKWKHFGYLFLGLIPFILAYIAYGTSLDSEIFWFIQARQSHRPVGFADLGWFFVSPAYDIFTTTDTWYIFCLMATVYFLFQPGDGRKRIVGFSLVYWLIVVMVSGGETDLLPWYRYPAFPLMAILGAWGIKELFTKVNFFSHLLAITMFLGNRSLQANPFRWGMPPMEFRLIFSSLMLPGIFSEFYKKAWLINLCRAVMALAFIVGMYWNITFIYNHFELICESKTCPTGPTTKLSELYFPIIYRFFVLGPPTN